MRRQFGWTESVRRMQRFRSGQLLRVKMRRDLALTLCNYLWDARAWKFRYSSHVSGFTDSCEWSGAAGASGSIWILIKNKATEGQRWEDGRRRRRRKSYCSGNLLINAGSFYLTFTSSLSHLPFTTDLWLGAKVNELNKENSQASFIYEAR